MSRGTVRRAPSEITLPPADGGGVNQPQPATALPDGYVKEYFLAGTATSFEAATRSSTSRSTRSRPRSPEPASTPAD